MIVIDTQKNSFRLKVKIVPKSSKNQIVGFYDGLLKVKITKPPENNLANLELIKFIAKHLKISKSSIEIVQGKKSTQKTLLITGDEENFLDFLNSQKK